MKSRMCLAILCLFIFKEAISQDNYEIQIYESPTIGRDTTMFELHSNYSFVGQKSTINEVLPTNHLLRETIEITHGFKDWMEVGFYLFNAIGNDNRSNFAGTHIRPRIALPDTFKFPIGLSLSAEFGYQKYQYSEDNWTLELRPIMDKRWGKLFLAFNPAFDKSLHGLNKNMGFTFSPGFKISYDISKAISPGLEYYGSIGPLNSILPNQQQQHQLFIVADINFSELWEFNMGYGIGFTSNTDKSIFKIILGRKFGR